MSLLRRALAPLLLVSLLLAQSPEEREGALARDPATLPRAVPGRWLDWKPVDPIPPELAGEFGGALASYREADYAAALVRLHAVLAREPDFPAALYQLGVTYFRLRRYGDGACVLERFLAAVPGEVGATQALGHCYYTLGDYARAQAHYERVLAAAPQSAEAWRGLGLAHLRQGATARALEGFDRALSLRPDHADALLWRGQALFDLGRSGDALAAVLRGLELVPHEPRGWFLLAQVQAELGKDEDAELSRARFRELSQIEQEVRTQEGILLHDPRALAPLLRLVLLHRASRNAPEQRAVLERALRIAPGDLDVLVLALETYPELGDTEAAARAAAELEARFAERREAWEALERHHRRSGDRARAEAAAAKVRALAGTK